MRRIVDFQVFAAPPSGGEALFVLSNDGLLFRSSKDGWLPVVPLPQDGFDPSNTEAVQRAAATLETVDAALAKMREAMGPLMGGFGAVPGGPIPVEEAQKCNFVVGRDGDEPIVCGMPATLLDANLQPQCPLHADWRQQGDVGPPVQAPIRDGSCFTRGNGIPSERLERCDFTDAAGAQCLRKAGHLEMCEFPPLKGVDGGGI